jgi:hypothetical protein
MDSLIEKILTAVTICLVIKKGPVMHPVNKKETRNIPTKKNEKRGKKLMPVMLMLGMPSVSKKDRGRENREGSDVSRKRKDK